MRFELTYYSLNPDIRVIAPWREWDLTSRTKLVDFAEKHQIPIAKDKRGDAPFSVDANLLHSSSEGKALEDPWHEPEEFVYQRTDFAGSRAGQAGLRGGRVRARRRRGDRRREAVAGGAADRSSTSSARPTASAASISVENRFVGMKSRGVYETPGGTILHAAHRGIESIALDRGAAHLKDELMPRYAELIYNGFWFSPERLMLQALIDKSQESVTGTVRLKLYKGNTAVVGRKSPKSALLLAHVTFEEDAGAYDQRDAAGFIKLNALRLRLLKKGRG